MGDQYDIEFKLAKADLAAFSEMDAAAKQTANQLGNIAKAGAGKSEFILTNENHTLHP